MGKVWRGEGNEGPRRGEAGVEGGVTSQYCGGGSALVADREGPLQRLQTSPSSSQTARTHPRAKRIECRCALR